MDKDEIKKYIIKLRENGRSYREISEALEKNFGVIRTRQAVYALYTREKRKQDIIDVEDKIILNYAVLGYTAEEIKILSKSELSITEIQRIIDSNSKELDEIYENIVYEVEKCFRRHTKIMRISYEDSMIKQSILDDIIEKAGLEYIKHKIKSGIKDIERYAGEGRADNIKDKLMCETFS